MDALIFLIFFGVVMIVANTANLTDKDIVTKTLPK